MNIENYYNLRKNGKEKYDIHLFPTISPDVTIKDFYNNCILNSVPKYWFDNALKWHKMLLKYVELDDAVFWVRYYESEKDKKAKVFHNRRACITKFDDDFTYVFVSNYDAHEIFNMVAKGVVPDELEFLKMMKSYTYPLHYNDSHPKHGGWPCEETDIAVYPCVGSVYGGVLTESKWYLAHITDIKGFYKRSNGNILKLSKTEKDNIYPRGEKDEWIKNKKIRKIKGNLTPEEKDIVKAHFLRFVDPLNYFLVPCVNNQTHTVSIHTSKKGTPKQIGEYDKLTKYVLEQYYNNPIIGGKIYKEYLKKIMADDSYLNKIISYGNTTINIEYNPNKNYKNGSTATTAIPLAAKKTIKYPEEKTLPMAKDYLFEGKPYMVLEREHLDPNLNGNGGSASQQLKKLGCEGKQNKGLFKGKTIDQAIALANGKMRETLEKIKELEMKE